MTPDKKMTPPEKWSTEEKIHQTKLMNLYFINVLQRKSFLLYL